MRTVFLAGCALVLFASPAVFAETLDLNSATVADLVRLPGIGKVKANAIVDYRKQAGGFQSVDDLRRVKGVGKVTLEKLRPLVSVGGQPAAQPAAASAQKAVAKRSGPKVDLNRATAKELMALPGIGKVKANAIVEYRAANGAFTSIHGLSAVRGISSKTVASLADSITVGDASVQVQE